MKKNNEENNNEELPFSDDGQCAICLKKYEEGIEKKHLPCGHAFHTTCVIPWLEKVSTFKRKCVFLK